MTTLNNLQKISLLLRELDSDELNAVVSYALRLKSQIDRVKENELIKNMESHQENE